MFIMLRSSLCSILLILLSGCSVNSSLVTKDYTVSRAEERMLPVNVIIDADDIPNEQLTNGAYANRIRRQKYILKVLLNEKAFFDISNNEVKYPITLHVKYHDNWIESSLSTANQLLSAATLYIVPYSIKVDVNLDIDVYMGKRKIKSFNYYDELDYMVSIINMPVHVEEVYLKKLLNNFLVDLSNSKILSPSNEKPNYKYSIDAV